MKMLDEKGRLFGLINIIDLGVLLIMFLLIGTVGYKLVGNKVVGSDTATKEVVIGVKCTAKPETAAIALQKGDQLVSGANYVNGFIESVSYTDASTSVSTDDGRVVLAKDPIKKDIYVTIKMNINTNTPVLKLGSQEVRVGAAYFVKTQKVELGGIIDSIQIK